MGEISWKQITINIGNSYLFTYIQRFPRKFFIETAMFSDFETEVTGFEAILEKERVVNDRGCQTADLSTSIQETQTTTTNSSAVQVAPEDACNFTNNLSYDADNLLKFLKRILPHLEEELKNCDSSSDLSFNQNEIEFNSRANDDLESHDYSEQHTIMKPDFCKEKVISCLSWNSTNVMLAVAYTEKDHEGWCNHETSVGLYNTGKLMFEKDPPVQLLNVSGCVRFIKFHDHIPSLLAGGLYTGEVIIWDLKNENGVLMMNKKGSGDEAPHVDVITFLTWRENENGLWLVTSGRDGRIILWKVTISNLTYEVYKKFIILKQHVSAAAEANEHLEVLYMDFQVSSSYFVVACGGGNIFYCSLATTRFHTPQYQDPFLQGYKPRKGIITGISCCSDLFASCGTDSEIHIFRYDQDTPVLKIHTKYAVAGVQWNSHRELISWGDSMVESHKIKDASKKKLICEFEGNISTVAFKTQSIIHSRKFGVGNQRGEILIVRDRTTN